MKKVPIPGFKLRKHFSVYFKLYKRLEMELDDKPRLWPDKRMRREILSAYLEGRQHDWKWATYLGITEAEIRNKMYKK